MRHREVAVRVNVLVIIGFTGVELAALSVSYAFCFMAGVATGWWVGHHE